MSPCSRIDAFRDRRGVVGVLRRTGDPREDDDESVSDRESVRLLFLPLVIRSGAVTLGV